MNQKINYNKQYKFKKAIKDNNPELVYTLLQDKEIIPDENDNYFVFLATELKYIQVLKVLLQDSRVDPSDNFNLAFLHACNQEDFDIISLFLEHEKINTHDFFESCVNYAVYRKKYNIVALIWNKHKNNEQITNQEKEFYKKIQVKMMESKLNEF